MTATVKTTNVAHPPPGHYARTRKSIWLLTLPDLLPGTELEQWRTLPTGHHWDLWRQLTMPDLRPSTEEKPRRVHPTSHHCDCEDNSRSLSASREHSKNQEEYFQLITLTARSTNAVPPPPGNWAGRTPPTGHHWNREVNYNALRLPPEDWARTKKLEYFHQVVIATSNKLTNSSHYILLFCNEWHHLQKVASNDTVQYNYYYYYY